MEQVSFSDGFALKATGTITATTIMGGYSRAGSGTARRLLQYLITPLPYPLISIQVDGGSGFRDELEPACQTLEIPLSVLPPKKPDRTAASRPPMAPRVARSFPSTKGLWPLRQSTRNLATTSTHNHYRPHDGIELETPMRSSTVRSGCLSCLTGTESGQSLAGRLHPGYPAVLLSCPD